MIPGPVSCRWPELCGLLETPPRWHATIYTNMCDLPGILEHDGAMIKENPHSNRKTTSNLLK